MLKVMIVDDEIIVRVGFQSCINWEAYGCQVVSTCESGGDAVEYMNRDVPDIVFTDIMMPGMDGIQLVKYISENHPDTKVVVLSCVDEIDYVKKAIKLGAEDYILKLSFTQDTLVELITRLKSMIEEERKKAGRGSLDMRVQSFNREEDCCWEIRDLGTMKCSWTGWDIPTIPLRPTRQAVFWWTTKE